MVLELTVYGDKIVIITDDSTTTVRLVSDTNADEKSYHYVPEDALDFVCDMRNVLLSFNGDSEFVLDQRVIHEDWGTGTVICMSNDGDVGVEFDEPRGFCHNCEGSSSGRAWGRIGTKNTSSWCRKSQLKALEMCDKDKSKHPITAVYKYIERKSSV